MRLANQGISRYGDATSCSAGQGHRGPATERASSTGPCLTVICRILWMNRRTDICQPGSSQWSRNLSHYATPLAAASSAVSLLEAERD
jgi:hypothetical protein